MPLSNLQTVVGASATLTATLPITDGVGNNRVAILLGMQFRAPPNLATPLLNSVAPTGTINEYTSSGTFVAGYYWLDDDLPTSGGNYSIGFSSGSGTSFYVAGLSWSGAKQAAPAGVQNVDGVTQTNTSFTLTADAGSVAVAELRVGGGVTPTANAGQTTLLSVAGYGITYDTTDLSIGWTHLSGASSALAFAIEPAPSGGLTITSVTPSSFDDGRTGIVIAGSGFGASQGSSTLTIGGQAQTVTAWSDTSITFTSVRGSVSPGNATLTLTKG